jgi:hypothetical protein
MAGSISATTQSLFTNTMRTPASAANTAMAHVKDKVCLESTSGFGKTKSKQSAKPLEKGVRNGQSGMQAANIVVTAPKVAAAVKATASA